MGTPRKTPEGKEFSLQRWEGAGMVLLQRSRAVAALRASSRRAALLTDSIEVRAAGV